MINFNIFYRLIIVGFNKRLAAIRQTEIIFCYFIKNTRIINNLFRNYSIAKRSGCVIISKVEVQNMFLYDANKHVHNMMNN